MTNITDEQRAAVEWLNTWTKPGSYVPAQGHARIILDALPSELTNPQPALPADDGHYLDNSGDVWRRAGRNWHLGSNFVGDDRARNFAPFTRLVPERPQITREQVEAPLNDDDLDWGGTVDALLALVNGVDQ